MSAPFLIRPDTNQVCKNQQHAQLVPWAVPWLQMAPASTVLLAGAVTDCAAFPVPFASDC